MKIAQDLQHLVVPIDALRPDPRNARKHNERNMRAIRTSLEMFGQRKPIVIDTDGVVIAGNGTLQAALSLGADRIAVVRFEGTPEEARSYALADNKTAELAEWDFPELATQLGELREISGDLLDASGFADFEIEPLLSAEWTPPAAVEAPPVPEDGGHTVKFTAKQWETWKACREALMIADDEPDAVAMVQVFERV